MNVTSLGGVRTIAATALGSALLAFVPVVAMAQPSDPMTENVIPEIGQANLPAHDYEFDIESQELARALVAFSRISGIDVVVDGVLSETIISPAVNGQMSPAAALDLLMVNSGLTWVTLNATTISVVAPNSNTTGANGTVTMPVIVTANRRASGPNGVPDEVYETPGSVAVITQESMRKLPIREARDIFSDVAGVDISNDARDPGLTVNVRGQQEMGRVNVNIDGARQNYNQLTHGTASRVYLDPALLAQVDVEKSNLAQNGGAGASAGIVTMRTLNTDDILDDGEEWGGKVNVSHGTNEYNFAGDASAGVRVSPKFDVSTAVSRKIIGNYHPGKRNPGLYQTGNGNYYSIENATPDFTYMRQMSGLVKANVYLTENQELNLGYVGTKSEYAKTSNVTNSTSNNFTDFNETKTHTVTAKHKWNPESDLVNLKSGMYWTRTENSQYRPERRSSTGTVTTDSFDNTYKLDTVGADVSNKSDLSFDDIGDGLSKVSFDYGTEFFHDKAKTTAEMGGLGGYGAAYQVQGSTPGGERDVYGGYLTATYGWNDVFQLSGGLRYDRYALNGDTFWCETQAASGNLCEDGGTPLDIDLTGDKVSPSFGGSITPFDGIQFFANYRENLRAPTIMEGLLGGDHIGNVGVPFYSNSNLQAEESETKEIGVNFKFDDVLQKNDGFRAKLSYYRSKIDNYTTLAYVPQPTVTGTIVPGVITSTSPKTAAAIVNLTDPVYINGTELEMFYDARRYYLGGTATFNDLDLQGNYNPYVLDTTYDANANNTYVNLLGTETIGDPIYGGANQLYGIYAVPKRKITLDGGLRFFDEDLVLGMRGTFVTPQDNVGNPTLSSIVGKYFKYRVFDFYSSYEVNDNLRLRFAVSNLFDEGYVQGTGGSYAPAPGRTAILTLSGNF